MSARMLTAPFMGWKRCLLDGLKMMTDWKGVCHRCGAKSNVHIMSMYNEQLICMDCKDKETKRDDYDKAVEADHEQIRQGNYNFKGVGLMGDR